MPEDLPLARVVGPGAVRLERRLAGPIERVWAFLTEPALRATWLAGGELEPHVGGRVTLVFRHAEITRADDAPPAAYRETHEQGHVAHGVVTGWQPPRLLRHTWDAGAEASEVTFVLRDEGETVLLTITHRRLDTRTAIVSVASGWDAHVATLAARLADAPTPAYWGAFLTSERRHGDAFSDERDAAGRPPGVATLSALADRSHRLRYERLVEAPIDDVWRVLAEPSWRDRWYPAELRFEGHVGGYARERFPGESTPLPEGTLTAWEPPRRLAFTMEADPDSSEPSVRHPQRVTITLEPANATTQLEFEYTFGDRSLAAAIGAGWHGCLDALTALAEGRAAQVDHAALRGLYDAWFADVSET
jgi:uncharacterized protein YndB with AHSA1/START domain